ncbi:uncharacterized protein LOC113279585 [Papaver somniferum]|uniref:uncharacterized protein LOC113279585 n=1 Tax=Papaver somniferum TaxID=3469 RepID=UPI000E6FB85D|nr:uncharacterized protein LOC113279585 [Papaver somniferum]
MNDGVQVKDWIASWFSSNNSCSPSHLKFITLVSFALWHIWKLRRAVVFDGASVNVTNFTRSVTKEIVECETNMLKQVNLGKRNRQLRTHTSWSLPECGYQKINFDASFLKENNTMGIGLISSSHAGTCGGAISKARLAQDED